MNAKPNEANLLRRTKGFSAFRAAHGKVRIIPREPRTLPRSRCISQRTWSRMENISDSEFDETCIMDLGIGVFRF